MSVLTWFRRVTESPNQRYVREAEERWTKSNAERLAAGCLCGKPSTHVKRYHDVVGSVPYEVWSCEEHWHVLSWERGPGDKHYRPSHAVLTKVGEPMNVSFGTIGDRSAS